MTYDTEVHTYQDFGKPNLNNGLILGLSQFFAISSTTLKDTTTCFILQ